MMCRRCVKKKKNKFRVARRRKTVSKEEKKREEKNQRTKLGSDTILDSNTEIEKGKMGKTLEFNV